MPIPIEEAVKIARAYGMSFTDAVALAAQADTPEEARHLAVEFAGSADERTGQFYTDERKKEDAEQAAEYEQLAKYEAKHPKPPKPKRVPVEPEYRDGMSDNDRVREMNKAHEANVKAEAEDRADAAHQSARDYYNWTASDDYRNWKASLD
jgi:hypothetical protein